MDLLELRYSLGRAATPDDVADLARLHARLVALWAALPEEPPAKSRRNAPPKEPTRSAAIGGVRVRFEGRATVLFIVSTVGAGRMETVLSGMFRAADDAGALTMLAVWHRGDWEADLLASACADQAEEARLVDDRDAEAA